MGYHEERSPIARLVEGVLDKLLRGPIHRRRRLVEEQNFGFTDQGSSDGEALFLADGEVAGARTQWRLKGLRRKVKSWVKIQYKDIWMCIFSSTSLA